MHASNNDMNVFMNVRLECSVKKLTNVYFFSALVTELHIFLKTTRISFFCVGRGFAKMDITQ